MAWTRNASRAPARGLRAEPHGSRRASHRGLPAARARSRGPRRQRGRARAAPYGGATRTWGSRNVSVKDIDRALRDRPPSSACRIAGTPRTALQRRTACSPTARSSGSRSCRTPLRRSEALAPGAGREAGGGSQAARRTPHRLVLAWMLAIFDGHVPIPARDASRASSTAPRPTRSRADRRRRRQHRALGFAELRDGNVAPR